MLYRSLEFNRRFERAVAAWDDRTRDEGITNSNPHFFKLSETYCDAMLKGAMFDARAFNIPREEVTNLIYWRQLDATRNSIQMVGQAYFSHNELQHKSCNVIQDMLHELKGINWDDYPTHMKRGSCCIKDNTTVTCAEEVDGEVRTWAPQRPHWVIDTEIPIFKGEGREYIEKLIQPEE